MITREDAKTLLGVAYSKINCNCIDKGLCTHQSNAFALERAFNEIYDSFEQHIKSLEAQLANTEQLTCDGCKYEYKENCLKQILPNKYHTFEFCCNKYIAKDTQ